ncbi:hypothetical protein FRB95_000988 [Tulasnella sp. JGI-2019a]|nr:hypothetical protein FRB95_000988 [Tulasnella sp. JGI-2019a]
MAYCFPSLPFASLGYGVLLLFSSMPDGFEPQQISSNTSEYLLWPGLELEAVGSTLDLQRRMVILFCQVRTFLLALLTTSDFGSRVIFMLLLAHKLLVYVL